MKYSKLFGLTLLFLVFTLYGLPLHAVTFNVTPTSGGGGEGPCAADPLTACNFQEALGVADSNGANDTINLAAGDYFSTPFTYTGAAGEDFTLEIVGAGADVVFLNADEDPENVLVIDTTGVGGDSAAHISIRQVTITGSANAGSSPGGLEVDTDQANITLENSVISNNVADQAGGMDLFSNSGNITLNNNVIFGNAAADTSDDGDQGGARIETNGAGAISLTGNSFISNIAQDDEGGAEISTEDGSLTLINNIFSGNSAVDDHGGCDLLTNTGALTLTGNTITKNSASENQGGCSIFTSSGTITLEANTVSQNSAITGTDGGLNVSTTSGDISFVNNILSDNTSLSDSGGVGLGNDTGMTTVTNNTVANNTAGGNGGGLNISLADETLASASIFNNIIFGNIAGGDGDDLFLDDDGLTSVTGVPVTVSHNDLSTALFSLCANTVGCTPDIMEAGLGNIMADPLFAGAGMGDFNLLVGSPAINAGDNAAPDLPATDHDGKPRIIGGTVDMGALETADSTINVSPTLLNFGDVAVGLSSGLILTISNDGIQDVNFTSMDLSDLVNYSLNTAGGGNPCGSTTVTLGAGTSCTLEVVFGPGSEGLKSATLTVNSDSADTPSIVIQLFGAGTAGGGGGCSCRLDAPASAKSHRVIALLMCLAFGGMIALRRRV